MLIGAHVSTAGGLAKAHGRGVEFGCDAIQIFNQSPRMWRPTQYKQPDVDEFRALMVDGPIRSVVIHAVYLCNPASADDTIRQKTLTSIGHALVTGDRIGAHGVVLHPGSAVGEPLPEAMGRIAEAVHEALARSETTPLLLENTAGAGQTIGRTFEELAELLERVGDADGRLGVCLDCCHLLASGYDVRTIEGLDAVIDDFDRIVGLDRLRCLHVNDSQAPLGSNRDRHADLPQGELGEQGIGAFLSEPRFEELPALLEVAGPEGNGPEATQVAEARRLREVGRRLRSASTAT